MWCPACNTDVPVRVYWTGTVKRHLRADCRGCGRYLKFLSQTADNVAQAEDADVGPTLFDTD